MRSFCKRFPILAQCVQVERRLPWRALSVALTPLAGHRRLGLLRLRPPTRAANVSMQLCQ